MAKFMCVKSCVLNIRHPKGGKEHGAGYPQLCKVGEVFEWDKAPNRCFVLLDSDGGVAKAKEAK